MNINRTRRLCASFFGIALTLLLCACEVEIIKQQMTKPTPEQPTPEKPTPEQPTPEKPTPEQPTPEKPTPEKPTPEKPTPEPPTPEPPTPEPPTPEKPTPEPPTPEPPTPEKPTPEKPTPEPPTPEPPTPEKPTPEPPREESQITIALNALAGKKDNILGGESFELLFSHTGTFDSVSRFRYEVSSEEAGMLHGALIGALFENIFSRTQRVSLATAPTVRDIPITVRAYHEPGDGQALLKAAKVFVVHHHGVGIFPTAESLNEGESLTVSFQRDKSAITVPLSFAISGAAVSGVKSGALFADGGTEEQIIIQSIRDIDLKDNVLTIALMRSGVQRPLIEKTVVITDLDGATAPVAGECRGDSASRCQLQRRIDSETMLPAYYGRAIERRIERAGDADWFRVDMAAGTAYLFSASTVADDPMNAIEIELALETALPSVASSQPVNATRISASAIERIFITPVLNYQYWLKVRSVKNGSGSYQIDIKQIDACAHSRNEIASYYWYSQETTTPYDYRTDSVCELVVGTARKERINGGVRDSDGYLVLLKPNTRYRFRVTWDAPPNRELRLGLNYIPARTSIADGGRQVIEIADISYTPSTEESVYNLEYQTGPYRLASTPFIFQVLVNKIAMADHDYNVIAEELASP